jgi:hypothetical protein
VRNEVIEVIRSVDEVDDSARVALVCRPEKSGAVICGYASLGEELVKWS